MLGTTASSALITPDPPRRRQAAQSPLQTSVISAAFDRVGELAEVRRRRSILRPSTGCVRHRFLHDGSS